MAQKYLRTVLGDIPISELGLILPHEHLFTDLRGPMIEDYAQSEPKSVLNTMLPFLKDAENAGVTALVECSTMGVGRNIEVLRHLAENTTIQIVAPTGIYKEAFTPEEYLNSSIDDLVRLWVKELTQSINSSDSKAGFIKIAVSDEGPTRLEERNIRAAARTSIATGACIASHTIGGKAALEELAILNDEGLNLEKFIWVHADSEPDLDYHREVMTIGAYVEFDFIGQPASDPLEHVHKVKILIEENIADRILLSHDAGWYQPGQPEGHPEGGIRGYTYISNEFIPLLLINGVDDQMVKLLTEENPKRAFAL
jgi:phosphotriesterase-related protein